jgi:hypothetical protein
MGRGGGYAVIGGEEVRVGEIVEGEREGRDKEEEGMSLEEEKGVKNEEHVEWERRRGNGRKGTGRKR